MVTTLIKPYAMQFLNDEIDETKIQEVAQIIIEKCQYVIGE